MKPPVHLVALLAVGAGSGLVAQEAAPSYEPTPLFATDDVLHLTLRMDMRRVVRDIDSTDRIEHPGRMSYVAETGETTDVPVDLRTRGHFRRQRSNCNFPPLRLDFPRDSVVGTVFQGQDKLKLVTHCQNGRDQYEAYLQLEYSVYRLFNVLTDIGYRARLARVTYIDVEAREDTLQKTAILLESDDELAARLGGNIVEVEGVHPYDTDQPYMDLVDLFQFMIGNTDWSVYALHNIVLLEVPGTFSVYAVPYDFDWTGIVNARYARPNERLGIRRVRDRLYRGFCRPPEALQTAVARMNEKRAELYAVYDAIPGMDDDAKEDAVEYLDDFFEIINDDGKLNREIMRKCREG